MWWAPQRVLDEYFLVRTMAESQSQGSLDQSSGSSQPSVDDLLVTDRTVHDAEMMRVEMGEEEQMSPQIGSTIRNI